jgi:hypothetical protein
MFMLFCKRTVVAPVVMFIMILLPSVVLFLPFLAAVK